MKRVGYWMSEKKSKKLNFEEQVDMFRNAGVELLKIDLEKPLEEQGPFDMILHKFTDILVKAQHGYISEQRIMRNIEDFIENHPDCIVVDPLDGIRKLLDRNEQYNLVLDCNTVNTESYMFIPTFVDLTSTDIDENRQKLLDANVQYPFVCKPIVAHGTEDCHKMAVIFNDEGLKDISPPCVAQTFVNHNATLYKIFKIGSKQYIGTRPSLKNLYAGDHPTIFFDTHEVCKSDSSHHLTKPDEEDDVESSPLKPNMKRLNAVSETLRQKLGLDLFGVDVIIECDTQRYAVIDINVFPSTVSRVNIETGPSNKWIREFLRRHHLTDRLAESITAARAVMSTEEVMDEFFDFYESVLHKYDVRNKQDQGSLPHKPIDGVPDSWLFAASDSGFMNTDIFYQWFTKIFIPHCGKERPVLLVMDNHNSHVSIPTIQTAIENDIILIGLPGNTTHILQPLDVKIFGPLKSRFDSICSSLPYARRDVAVGKATYPAILRHAIDQATPASIQRAFEVTGLCPVNRHAIDQSQLVPPAFKAKKNGVETVVAETCPTCGNFVKNPLVEMGIVSDRLSQVLVPPPSAPLQVEKKVSKKKVEKGRVFSSVEMLNELKEKERQELERQKAVEERKKEMEKRREAKAKEAEEKRVRLEKKRIERVEKRKREEMEKEERKRIRMERKESKASSSKAKKTANINSQLAALSAAAYMCGVCGARGTIGDEENGVQWFGCDSCDRWFHDACLSHDEILRVRTSLTENSFWNCKFCLQTEE